MVITPGMASMAATTLFSVASGIGKGEATKAAARRQRKAAYYDAANIEQEGEQAFAVSQRKAVGEQRRADQVIRHLMASFSAGGPISSGQLSLMANLEAQKAYNISSVLATGKSREDAAKHDAMMKRISGDLGVSDAKSASDAYKVSAGANLFSGAVSLYDRYKEANS